MPRPISAQINLDALTHNLHTARRATSSSIMAVIKADAYGHGLLRVAEALNDAEGFALLDIQDAIVLRESGFTQTILLLEGFFSADDLQAIAQYDLSCVVHSDWQIKLLDAYPKRGSLSVWLKVNSGMHRLGFSPEQVASAMARLRAHVAIREVTLMTHFAHADEPRGVREQLQIFHQLACDYRVPRSLANSAAMLRYPQTHGDWVRLGIMLYGASPFADKSADELRLRPVMTLSSKIIAIQNLQRGDEIGYGAQFKATHNMRVGVVACGYADGYPRHALTGTPVLVNGQRTQTLGRVSMDMLYVDLSPVLQAEVGSEVVLWGEGMPVEDVAHAAGTISYEVLCSLAKRVPIKLC